MPDVDALSAALSGMARFLEDAHIPYMVIGGVANLAWGEARTTQDVDITVAVDESRLDELVARLGDRFQVLPASPLEFIRETRVLPLATVEGVRIDLIFAGLPYEEEAIARATSRVVAGQEVRVATAEDLLVHKLLSLRPRDREDAAGVIDHQRENLDRGYLDPLVRQVAEILEDPAVWDWYDSRMRGHRG